MPEITPGPLQYQYTNQNQQETPFFPRRIRDWNQFSINRNLQEQIRSKSTLIGCYAQPSSLSHQRQTSGCTSGVFYRYRYRILLSQSTYKTHRTETFETRMLMSQNSAAKLIFCAKKRDHVTPLLKSLHWLPKSSRITYKICVVCHGFFSGSSPSYLYDILTTDDSSRSLRSATESKLLLAPKTRRVTYGDQLSLLLPHVLIINSQHTFARQNLSLHSRDR